MRFQPSRYEKPNIYMAIKNRNLSIRQDYL